MTPELVIFSAKQDTVIQAFAVTISGIAITTLGNTEIIAKCTAIGMRDVVVADTLRHGHVINSASSYLSSAYAFRFSGCWFRDLVESVLQYHSGRFQR